MTAGVIISIAAWHLLRRQNEEMMRPALKYGLWGMIIAFAGVALSGDQLSLVMVSTQPMKMAAAEALYATTTGAPLSLFAIGSLGADEPWFSIEVPWLLSILAKGDPNAEVQGINDLQAEYAARFGAGDYVPVVPVAFWSFRLMIGVGVLAAALALAYLWRTRRGRDLAVAPRWLLVFPFLPAAANTFGWIFTETARQPWLVFGHYTVADGVSPGLTAFEVWLSLAGFTAVYGLLAVVWFRLVLHLARQPLVAPPPAGVETDPVPVY
jgi:cytochrome d ubiquinol oxidase subunit I